MKNIYLVLLLTILTFGTNCAQNREYINLSGQWQFELDTANIGIEKNWHSFNLNDSIILPGTTDLSRKGFLNRDTTTLHLNRVYKYEGAAWYRKKVFIPQELDGKRIILHLERTKQSIVWIDTAFVGKSILLQSPQEFDITDFTTPGEHFITIRIDNSLKLTPYGNVHIYSDDTQTNWNGIIGEIFLEASDKTFISNLQVYPDIGKKSFDAIIEIENKAGIENFRVNLFVERTLNGSIKLLDTKTYDVKYEPSIKLNYMLGDECFLWDDYEQPIYKLTAVITGDNFKDGVAVNFSMRKFSIADTQFEINGRKTFLRGKHDACVFPLTGHPPMDLEGWIKTFKIAKSYGINHYRFHSYCPPKAAFDAADKVGIFLQAELPFWGGLESDSVANMLNAEGKAMLRAYANHPSFVMFGHGNEIWNGHDLVEKNIISLKEYDNRPLYTMGSNNNIGYVAPRECSDFFVAARTPFAHDTTLTHLRLTHAFADSRDGGILNTQTPSTEINFSYPVSQINIPIVSHEIGQYQIYPDYNEIEKYTGVLRAWNLEVFRHRLKQKGMLDQTSDFQMATGAWAALCYKAEMEAAIRTKGLAGFQLLDLQDFPGQGTALVGILNAFMESKNVVAREDWLSSCNDVVLLLEFPKYCWTNNETFHGKVKAANYLNNILRQDLIWQITNSNGKVISQGAFANSGIKNGDITELGRIVFPLTNFNEAEKITIKIFTAGNKYFNSYPIWIYPEQEIQLKINDIIIAEELNAEILSRLKAGKKILLFPTKKLSEQNSFAGHFPPEFWNYGMFKGISEWAKKPVSPGTLGILTNPSHPIFKNFPTDFHTNWQWFSIIKASRSLILDPTPQDYKPIVQIVDNLERNHKLGIIFEFKYGTGKLLICTSPLNKLETPEAKQLYQSILHYMDSNDFNPAYEIEEKLLSDLFDSK